MNARKRILPWLAPAMAFAAAGCGLFSTRPAQPPGGIGAVAENFTLPESTLATMQRAFFFKKADIYSHCLADTSLEQRDFHATFDPSDITAAEQAGITPPPDWNREEEQSFFPQFLAYNPNAAYALILSQESATEDIGGATGKKIYHQHYRVFAGASAVCAGTAGITLERVGASSQYKITFWEDRRDTANVRTMGAARLNGR